MAAEAGLGKLGWWDFLVHTELCTMNYDCLSMAEDDRLVHAIRMMENFQVPQALKKNASDLVPLIYDVQQIMRANSYHNFCHVIDVTQYMYTLLLATRVAQKLAPVEVAAAFIGALCHDLDHPGLSNAYQNSTKSPLSQKYDADSPLERHHLSEFERLAAKHELLDNLNETQQARFRDVVQHMILATDMSKHGMLMRKIADKLSAPEYNPLHSADGVNLVLQIGLKCADISNQARPWKVANRWNDAVYTEFYHEGDLDRAAGRDVAPLYDRNANQIPKSTAGFIHYLVAPLYEVYVAIMKRCASMDGSIDSRAVEECLVFLHKNKARYQLLADGEHVDRDEDEEELLTFAEDLRGSVDVNARPALPGVNGEQQRDTRKQFLRAIKMAKHPPEIRAV
ncbi:putative 3'5'-cyclic nucleotide phosphodiesterase [Pelagophyceae sp. CCMP2097]|nr:putative 3'5'-cyclic nucleotide phosphodiesterase [Pelagophyceae sp. CCMP2097]